MPPSLIWFLSPKQTLHCYTTDADRVQQVFFENKYLMEKTLIMHGSLPMPKPVAVAPKVKTGLCAGNFPMIRR